MAWRKFLIKKGQCQSPHILLQVRNGTTPILLKPKKKIQNWIHTIISIEISTPDFQTENWKDVWKCKHWVLYNAGGNFANDVVMRFFCQLLTAWVSYQNGHMQFILYTLKNYLWNWEILNSQLDRNSTRDSIANEKDG